MENNFRGLPPSKRFKLLHLQENPQPSDSPIPACLPAKKRLDPILHHHHHPVPTTSLCLPAKKRVWAPHILSPLKRQHEDPNPIRPQSHVRSQDDEEPSKQQDEDQQEEDDGVICAVCRSTDGDPVDPIVFCDGCDLMVHATCYGNPLINSIPEGDWFCLRCCERKGKEEEEKPRNCCCLCPVKGGAVKPTTDGRWAHIMCALLVPEVFFRDPDGRDGIDCSRVPNRRRDMDCYICGFTRGCAIECSEPKCGLGFHVSCGLEKGLSIEYKESRGGAIVAGFCVDHTQLWKKQQITGKFKIVPREREPKGKTRS